MEAVSPDKSLKPAAVISPRTTAVSMTLTLAFLLCGVYYTLKIGKEANLIYHELFHARLAVNDMRVELSRQPAVTGKKTVKR